MNHILPKLEDILDKNEIAESLNIPIDSIIKIAYSNIFLSFKGHSYSNYFNQSIK